MAPATDYDFNEPNEEYALRSFERVLGAEEARSVWERALAAIGLSQRSGPLTRQQLHRVASHLAGQEGFVGVMGASLKIRLDTYDILAPMMNGSRREPDPPAS
jgi:hypothetical protein